MVELKYTFIPFMMGSIALIAYLSLRNFYLAKTARKLSHDLNDKMTLLQKKGLIVQISWFTRRYRVSNTALIIAIFSVMCFGSMIASSVINWERFGHKILQLAPYIFLICGGMLSTMATAMSIYEASVARRSLFTAIGVSIANSELLHQSSPLVIHEVEKIATVIKKCAEIDLYNQIKETFYEQQLDNPPYP